MWFNQTHDCVILCAYDKWRVKLFNQLRGSVQTRITCLLASHHMSHVNGRIINGPLKSFIQFNSAWTTITLPNSDRLAVRKVIKERAFSTSIERLALVGGAAEEGCFHLEPNGLRARVQLQNQKGQQGIWSGRHWIVSAAVKHPCWDGAHLLVADARQDEDEIL